MRSDVTIIRLSSILLTQRTLPFDSTHPLRKAGMLIPECCRVGLRSIHRILLDIEAPEHCNKARMAGGYVLFRGNVEQPAKPTTPVVLLAAPISDHVVVVTPHILVVRAAKEKGRTMSSIRRRSIALGAIGLWCASAAPAHALAAFNYTPIAPGEITDAFLMIETAGLTAHQFFGASQVNMVTLFDVTNTANEVDLSNDFFGGTAFPAAPLIDQWPDQSNVLSVSIPPSFFSVLESGRIGLWALLTDTDDAQFAIDTIELLVNTSSGSVQSFYGSPNDGFGIGLPDGNSLGGLPSQVLPPGSTGTGFDETISSKSIHVPAPGPALIMIASLGAGAARRRRREGRAR